VSKTKEKRADRLIIQAEFLWERAQVQALVFTEMLDNAVAIYEEHKDTLEEEVRTAMENQIGVQRKQVEDFISITKLEYLQRLREADEQR